MTPTNASLPHASSGRPVPGLDDEGHLRTDTVQLVTVSVGGQLFGIAIERVRDVFRLAGLTPIPLAPPVVAGLYNLRGRVMTTLCLATMFGLPGQWRGGGECMALGLDWRGESFGIIVDGVGDVMSVPRAAMETNPAHLDARWAALCRGIHRLPDRLLVELDVDALLDRPLRAAA
jgi:purine-binding chemotaxis protein CheW